MIILGKTNIRISNSTKKANRKRIKTSWGIQFFSANNCLNQKQVFGLDINENETQLGIMSLASEPRCFF